MKLEETRSGISQFEHVDQTDLLQISFVLSKRIFHPYFFPVL